MPIVEEPSEHALKKWEELYALTKDGLLQQSGRFDALERKVDRYFAITSIFLGAIILGSGEFVQIWKMRWGWLVVSFLLSYMLLAIAILASISVYVVCLALVDFRSIPINDELLSHFDGNQYIDVLGAMSRGNIGAFAENEEMISLKVKYAVTGHRLTIIVLALSVVAAVLYVAVALR